MALAEQMGVELVDVAHLFTADIALPWVALAVAALVEEVQRLVGELDAAEETLQMSFGLGSPGQEHVGFRPCGRDRPV